MTKTKCVVPGCSSRDERMKRFPTPRDIRFQKWIKAVRSPLLSTMDVKKVYMDKRICLNHFRDTDFHMNNRNNKLLSSAVPNRYLPTDLPDLPVVTDLGNALVEDALHDVVYLPCSWQEIKFSMTISSSSKCVVDLADDVPWRVSELGTNIDSSVKTNLSSVQEPDDSSLRSTSPENDDNECWENNGLSESSLLEDLMKELCRVCGKRDSSLIPIYDESENYLAEMLEKYLPLQVGEKGIYPSNICLRCYNTVHEWHDLYVTCVAANGALKSIKQELQVPEIAENSESDVGVADVPSAVSTVKAHTTQSLVVDNGIEEQNNFCENYTWKDTSNGFLKRALVIDEPVLQVYNCKYCGEKFRNISDKNVHYNVCRENPTLCETCGLVISHQKQLLKHKLLYHDNRSFLCDICCKSINIHSLIEHMKLEHSHFCDLCCKSLRENPVYDLHMKKRKRGRKRQTFKITPVVQNENLIYVCPVCGQTFNKKSSVILHLTKPNSVKCSACVRNLKNEKQLILHSCKTWNCQYCPKSFLNKRKWCEHERTHAGMKPFKCYYCDATFRRISQRSAHQRTHYNFPYDCSYCSKKFRFLQSLHSHVSTCHVEYC